MFNRTAVSTRPEHFIILGIRPEADSHAPSFTDGTLPSPGPVQFRTSAKDPETGVDELPSRMAFIPAASQTSGLQEAETLLGEIARTAS